MTFTLCNFFTFYFSDMTSEIEKQPRSIAEITSILEALIFVAEEPINAKILADVPEEDAEFVQSAIENLANNRRGLV